MLGCGAAFCERLPLTGGQRIFRTILFVCKYTPTFFSGAGALYREGPCNSGGSCPVEFSMCVQFRGNVMREDNKAVSYCGER